MMKPILGSETLVLGRHTWAEIWSQDESWTSALDWLKSDRDELERIVARHEGELLILIACGSPFYLSKTAAATFQRITGRIAIAVPAGEVLLDAREALPFLGKPLVVAVSRSGETSELLAACDRLRDSDADIIAITTTAESSLTKLASLTLALPNADEVSLAQTRSFGAMLIATLAAVGVIAHSDTLLSDIQEGATLAPIMIDSAHRAIESVAGWPFDRITFLGSGQRYGLACEGMVKTAEMALTDATAHHFLEFRHGPQALIDDKTLVVGLLSSLGLAHQWAVLDEMHGLGAAVLAIGGSPRDTTSVGITHLPRARGTPEVADLLAALPAIQLAAFKQAMHRDLDPDVPRHLSRYVELSELA